MAKSTVIGSAVLGVAVVLGTGAALATPSTSTTTPLARGDLDHVDVHHDGIEVESHNGSTDVAVSTITFQPGQSSGWHHHPGVVLVVVKSGTLTEYSANCHTVKHKAGDGFVEAGNSPSLVRNNGQDTAVVEVTFIVPSSTPADGLRIDDAQPEHCSAQ